VESFHLIMLLNVIMNRHKVIAKLIQLSVPVLNIFRTPDVWPYPFENLAEFEDETLGRELYNFLSIRNLGYLPKYEEHDSYHVLLGYGTTVIEELKLQAFMWGNKNSTFAGKVLFILGWIVFPSKHSLFRREIIRGKSAKSLSNIPVVSMIPKNLSGLRREFCIS